MQIKNFTEQTLNQYLSKITVLFIFCFYLIGLEFIKMFGTIIIIISILSSITDTQFWWRKIFKSENFGGENLLPVLSQIDQNIMKTVLDD